MEIIIEDEERMSLLGLIFKVLLSKNLAQPSLARLASGMRGDVSVQAGRMCVTLSMSPSVWALRRGPAQRPSASVRGSLSAFTAVAARHWPVASFLRGELWAWGNPWLLWKLLRLIRG